MVIFWARTLQKSKFHLQLSKFLYFNLRCSKIYSWQETDSSKSWFKIAFHKTWHCISLHEHLISLHCTACHFEIQNSWFQNFQSRLEFQLFSKLISKPWVFKIINSSHFTPPGLWISKYFLRKTIWIVFNMGFSHFISDFALVTISNIFLLQNRPTRANSFQKFLFYPLVQILWKFQKEVDVLSLFQ